MRAKHGIAADVAGSVEDPQGAAIAHAASLPAAAYEPVHKSPMLVATAEIALAAAANATHTTFTVPPEMLVTPVAPVVGIVVAEFCAVTWAEPASTAESPEVMPPVPVIELETAATFAVGFAVPMVRPPTIAMR